MLLIRFLLVQTLILSKSVRGEHFYFVQEHRYYIVIPTESLVLFGLINSTSIPYGLFNAKIGLIYKWFSMVSLFNTYQPLWVI